MLNQPRFKPHLRVQVVPGEGVFVLSDARQSLLRGRLYEQVVPCVDGRSVEQIGDQLRAQISPAEVYFVLGQLEKKGYLCEKESSLPPAEAAWWSAHQVEPATVERRLAETPVTLQAFGVETAPLADLLRALRVRVEEDGPFGVVAADTYLREELQAFNTEALRSGRPWLLIRPVGRQLWIGPLFRPGVTGCWECLAQRLRANHPVAAYVNAKTGSQLADDPAHTAATLHIAWSLAAQAVAVWIARGELPSLEGTIQTFDVAAWKMQSHMLIRLPYCPACGARETIIDGEARPLILQNRPKTFTQDGGHRVVAPEETLERYGRHVSPITGAVSMLERVGVSNDGAMHVYLAGTNLARRHRSLDHLRGDLRNMSSGKGVSDVQARASGLCEGLERYSGVFRGDEPRRRARLRDLGEAALPPNECMLFSERQYRERDAWNNRKSTYNYVPRPFDPEMETEWTPVWSLTRRESRYLPTAFCYFNYPYPDHEPFCVACSNGNAAGNTLEEAILQGFFELVERDSVALWWYSRVRRPGVDLDSFTDPYLGTLQEFLHGRGREMWVLDLTSDLNVPVFTAVCRYLAGAEERIVLGFGAHLDAHIALLRAVTEMNQMLSSLLQEPDREVLAEHVTDQETVHWLRTATVANQPYLLPDEAVLPRRASAYARTWSDDVTEDVRACQVLVERQGMEMLVLDQTRAEIGLPVAKVIVPGLRHFWARFAPGRLYDVPVRLGWLPRSLAEDELNPIPMFL
ncbi:MAG TPA: TOMM precursor leader peptide-binding protein [Gemmataceae bacterium]|nr:TOMM precursor leader peptide-binding protein [Gemmataceae bacterium]